MISRPQNNEGSYSDNDNAVPANYDFQWEVKDDYSGNDFGQNEARQGANTQGSYYVLMPDGRRQKVEYKVEGYSGFQAEVSYDGEVNFQEQQPLQSGSSQSRRYQPAPPKASRESRVYQQPARPQSPNVGEVKKYNLKEVSNEINSQPGPSTSYSKPVASSSAISASIQQPVVTSPIASSNYQPSSTISKTSQPATGPTYFKPIEQASSAPVSAIEDSSNVLNSISSQPIPSNPTPVQVFSYKDPEDQSNVVEDLPSSKIVKYTKNIINIPVNEPQKTYQVVAATIEPITEPIKKYTFKVADVGTNVVESQNVKYQVKQLSNPISSSSYQPTKTEPVKKYSYKFASPSPRTISTPVESQRSYQTDLPKSSPPKKYSYKVAESVSTAVKAYNQEPEITASASSQSVQYQPLPSIIPGSSYQNGDIEQNSSSEQQSTEAQERSGTEGEFINESKTEVHGTTLESKSPSKSEAPPSLKVLHIGLLQGT